MCARLERKLIDRWSGPLALVEGRTWRFTPLYDTSRTRLLLLPVLPLHEYSTFSTTVLEVNI